MPAPKKKLSAGNVQRIGDEALKEKTGKTWPEWFRLLDKAGAASMSHKDIAALLYKQMEVPGWWAQMVTVGYEQERGLRVKNQTCYGDFQVSVSRVIAVPVSTLYEAITDARLRSRWLPKAPIEITTARPAKSVRAKWTADDTRLDVNLYAKGETKSQIALGHTKIRDEKAAAAMKKFWGEALDRLKESLEK